VSEDQPVLRVLLGEAVTATGASSGWVVAVADGTATVVATTGSPDALGTTVDLAGSRGFALASGQPAALLPGPTDTADSGVGAHQGVPPSLLVAPGGEGRVLLEVAAKQGGGAFTFDDIEVLSSYASIAEAVVGAGGGRSGPEVASPARLGAELAALAVADADRYREVAGVVELLLGADR